MRTRKNDFAAVFTAEMEEILKVAYGNTDTQQESQATRTDKG